MTRYLLDVASYQGDLRPQDVAAAGFSAVNLKVSHGLGRKSVHPDVGDWAARARTLELGLSTFHWLTADADGAVQAEYAYRRVVEIGAHVGAAHQLDVEAQPRPELAEVRAYLERITALLGRPVALYTGDWYWPAEWNVADLTPYLWSAPNAGYLGAYPGDTSPHWTAGYGGWPELAVMQYAVSALPGGSIKVSKSAIRDERVWRHLTLGRLGMSYAPDRIMEARKFVMDTLRAAGQAVNPASYGVVGDDAHANAGSGYHIGKDALKSNAYSIVESSRDRNGLTNAASAFDIGWFSITVKGKTHNLRSFSVWLVAQCKAGTADTKDIREVIYSPDGKSVKRWDRLSIRSTGDDSHLSHTHMSWFRDSEKRDKTALFRRYFTEIGLLEGDDDMTPAEMLALLKSADGKAALRTAVREELAIDPVATVYNRNGYLANKFAPDVLAALEAILKNVQADDADLAKLQAALAAHAQATATASAQAVRDAFGAPDAAPQDIASALVAALGRERAAAVGAILKG